MVEEKRLIKIKRDLIRLLKRAINDIDEKRKVLRVFDWFNFTDEWKNISLAEKQIKIAVGTESGFNWMIYLPTYPNGFVLNDYRIVINSNKKVFTLDGGNEDGFGWRLQADVSAEELLNIGFRIEQITGNHKLREKVRRQHFKRKGLGYIKLTPPLNIPFDWHHIDKEHVVAAPTKLHEGLWHSLKNKKSMQRINNAVEEWYNDNNIMYNPVRHPA